MILLLENDEERLSMMEERKVNYSSSQVSRVT
jgi:hypothetical protein